MINVGKSLIECVLFISQCVDNQCVII